MEVLEWNEALDEADGAAEDSPQRARLDELAHTLHDEHDRILSEVGAALDPLPAAGAPQLAAVRRKLNAVRYLARALYRIRDLRFGTPTT
jgi:hypothetical protein